MSNNSFKFTSWFLVQIFLFLFTNALFILKYVSRIEGINAGIILIVYILFSIGFFYLYTKVKWSEQFYKIAFWGTLALIAIIIIVALLVIDPYSVRVDRWSAVSFFIDGLFRGDYPYGVHTHVGVENFPSPFPVWYIINLPFYFLGDVGIGLIFFLGLTAFCVRYFFNSYKKSFLFLLLLFISPAYWWEVIVRSDSLSNALLVFCFIAWFSKKEYTLSERFGLAILFCSLLASTRLSALLPLALFFFKPWLNLTWKRKIIFPFTLIAIIFLTFSPFIFWDTTTWIFFSRNPFMSETSVGNIYVLLLMLLLGCVLAYRWKRIEQFLDFTALFIFLFILSSQISLLLMRGVDGTIFTDVHYDISYFTLAFPYCLASLSEKIDLLQMKARKHEGMKGRMGEIGCMKSTSRNNRRRHCKEA